MASRSGPPTRASSRTRSTSQQPVPAPAPRSRTTAKPASKQATTTRKPLANAENSPERTTPVTQSVPATKPSVKVAKPVADADKEPIKAYLRIRPRLGADASKAVSSPYLEPLSDTTVHMANPDHTNEAILRTRTSFAPPSSNYTFSHVFPAAAQQAEFFTRTTLPLVKDLLCEGQSGLLFAYGVTNSGKTFTMQGGNEEGEAGILPRTLDVIFNSIGQLQSETTFRPVRLQGIAPAEPADHQPALDPRSPALAKVIAEQNGLDTLDEPGDSDEVDMTAVKVDKNYDYSVWLSYAEVYNEKIYDLLGSSSSSGDVESKLPRPAGAPSSSQNSMQLLRKALSIKPSPAEDSYDDDAPAGKYVHGLRQVRVRTTQEAKALVKLGQLSRRVFGTLANSQSSRSHGVVTVKVLRQHRGEKNDPTAIQTSRLTLVDLAGSERTKNTQTTGDRLKEAGNINKSLMVLGQCMETMRANQRKVAQSLAGLGRHDTRDVKRTLAVVPFRHSKLTEMLMDYFVGDARVVMIVNINPYDTGFDENSHVMKFAAIAREVCTTTAPAPVVHRLPPPSGLKPPASPTKKPTGPSNIPRASEVHRRQVTITSIDKGGRESTHTCLEVLEEDEEPEDNDDDEFENPLVDALFDEIEHLRMQLFEAEMALAIVEAETREEVMEEMEGRMQDMERMYTRRLMKEVEQQQLKADAKIEMLHQAGLFGHTGGSHSLEDLEEEDEVDMSLRFAQEEADATDPSELPIDGGYESLEDFHSRSSSPLDGRTGGQRPGQPASSDKPSLFDASGLDLEPPLQNENVVPLMGDGSLVSPINIGTDNHTGTTQELPESAGIQPQPTSRLTTNPSEASGSRIKRGRSSIDELVSLSLPPLSQEEIALYQSPSTKVRTRTSDPSDREMPPLKKVRARRLSKQAASPQAQEFIDVDALDDDNSAIVIPDKEARKAAIAHGGPNVEYIPRSGEVESVKKKKRQLGKKPVTTEEQIVQMTSQQEQNKPVRRVTRIRKL